MATRICSPRQHRRGQGGGSKGQGGGSKGRQGRAEVQGSPAEVRGDPSEGPGRTSAGRGASALLRVQLLLLPLGCSTPVSTVWACSTSGSGRGFRSSGLLAASGGQLLDLWVCSTSGRVVRFVISARIPSSSSCLHCTSGSGRGFSEWRGSWLLQVSQKNAAAPVLPREKAPLWLRQRCYANLICTRVLPMLQNAVSILGSSWGGVSPFCTRFDRVLVLAVRLCVALRLQLFLRMRLRLLYLCLRAWPPCCRSVVGVVVILDVSGSGLPEKSASVLQGRSQGTRWKASCQLVSMLGFFTTCQCFSLICYEGPAFCASLCWLQALRGMGGAFGALGCFRFMQKELLFVFCRCFRTGCPGCGFAFV